MNNAAAGQDETRAGRGGGALDPRVSLATSVHSSPGTYALLLGSGISISAGIKTGWGMVQDLVSRAATAMDPHTDGAGAAAAEDPEKWWAQHGDGPLGYSALLAAVAPTAAARQAVLRSYFDPKPDEAGQLAAVAPGAAHRAIAQLVLRGSIKVILTTNFDRLIERALEEVGISPQVIHSPEQFAAATPLAHSRVTVVKLHGDYLDLHLRNTVDELGGYPQAQQKFLERVADEYGLIVCGWSAEWDHALAGTLEVTRSRRYPLFWSHLGPLGTRARTLTAQHSATLISDMTADAFFEDLLHRLEALDQMTEPPISREMAVARLKRSLLDPMRRIEVFDLIEEALGRVTEAATLQRYPLLLSQISYEASVHNYRADIDTLLHLMAAGVFHDDASHDRRWVKAIQRLSRLRNASTGPSLSPELETLRHYPALLATWTSGVAAVLAEREDLLISLLTEPTWVNPWKTQEQQPAARYLTPTTVLSGNQIGVFFHTGDPRQPWRFPHSRLLREQARDPLCAIEPDDESYQYACDRFEFLASMVALDFYNDRAKVGPLAWLGAILDYDFQEHAKQIEGEIFPNWPMVEAGGFGGDAQRARRAHKRVVDLVSQLPVML